MVSHGRKLDVTVFPTIARLLFTSFSSLNHRAIPSTPTSTPAMTMYGFSWIATSFTRTTLFPFKSMICWSRRCLRRESSLSTGSVVSKPAASFIAPLNNVTLVIGIVMIPLGVVTWSLVTSGCPEAKNTRSVNRPTVFPSAATTRLPASSAKYSILQW